jgi:putative phosphoribosyl transferase
MGERFKNRKDAGERLARFIHEKGPSPDMIFAVPRGGVEVAAPIARRLKIPLLVVFIRKLPYPFSPEMGFGSIDEKGQVLLNPDAEFDGFLSEETVRSVAKKVQEEVLRRKWEFSPFSPSLSPEGKSVLLIDDGIATGASLRAAVHYLKSFHPKAVWIAAGCGYGESIDLLKTECDGVVCLAVQHSGPFAVASFYDDFRDCGDEEIKEVLAEVNQKWLKNPEAL